MWHRLGVLLIAYDIETSVVQGFQKLAYLVGIHIIRQLTFRESMCNLGYSFPDCGGQVRR